MSKVTPGPDIFRGRRVDKYEVLTRLNVGGMSELFLAFTAGPGGFRKFVVIKQILPDIASDEAFVRMFLDEARITAALSHPNIGQVYELGEEEERLYLAMEYIAGQNLEHIIRRAARKGVVLPIGFSVKIIRDLCLALNYAHNFSDLSTRRLAGIVHRDVSPKNIMVTYAGTVKVVDFGIAKARNRLIHTRVGTVKGTSGYMSPEQVRNETIDGRTDVFASAVVLYELLTGQRLFLANTDLVMMKKIAEGAIPPPQKLNPGLSSALCAVVMKGLERNVQERFQSGQEMARALEKAYPDIADEGKTARFMSELFPDKMKQAQALLESASVNDSQELYQAVRALRDDSSDFSKPPHLRRPSSSLSALSSSGSRHAPSPPRPSQAQMSPASKPHAAKPGQNFHKRRSSSLAEEKQLMDEAEDKTPVFVHLAPKPFVAKHWMLWLMLFAFLGALAWAVAWGPLNAQAKSSALKRAPPEKEDVPKKEPVMQAPPEGASLGGLVE